ncbi:MAG: zinc-dependent metalloprotease, partial [Proteobacteria bacterium]|nr:zinc-dependent metalloprotease [Pseudomonadota bacterium]
PIPGAATPDEEKEALNQIAARQEREPYLRFGNADGIDPTAQTEDLGDDPVAATRYGMLNLKRVASMLLSSTTKEGEDYSTLKEVYDQLVAQRTRELGHVANVIGGVERTNRVAGQDGVVHVPVSKQKQREAMQFLLAEGFRTPTEILLPEILSLVEPTGTQDRVLRTYQMLLNIVLNNGRLERLVNTQGLAKQGETPYGLSEMLADLRNGIWSELSAKTVRTDLYRRNLQRAYLETVKGKLNPAPPSPASTTSRFSPPPLPGEARALLRYELEKLDASIGKALPGAADVETRAHLNDSKAMITQILDPEEDR